MIDFTLNAMRFTGWKTWLNLAIIVWFEILYLMVNYSYVIKYQRYLYGFMQWHTSPEISAVIGAGFILFNIPLWYMYWGFSLLKEHYYEDQVELDVKPFNSHKWSSWMDPVMRDE